MSAPKMKYLKRFKTDDRWIEITYEEALYYVLGSYRDCEEVRKLLETDNTLIPLMFSQIKVVAE